MQPSGDVEVSARLLSAMLREREFAPRAALLAQQAAELVPGGAAVVYVLNSGDPPAVPATWTAKATAGDIRLDEPTIPAESGTLGTLVQEQQPLLFSGNDLAREDYAHLLSRRTLVSLACIPIMVNEALMGALEVASFEGAITASDVQTLTDLVEHAGPGLVSAILYEDERNSLLESVSRLTQLYDLEKVFSATLEMDELRPLITSKTREVLGVQAVNLWFVKDQNELLLMHQSGDDPTAPVGSAQRTGEGYVAQVSDSNEPLLIEDSEDERLAKRNPSAVEGGPFSAIVCPLVAHEKQLGVIEAINKIDGSPFDEDDLFLLNSISETAAIALNNAGLLQAERKVEILEMLVTVSQEITSTLNLERVLQTIVNAPQAVIPYERAAVALEHAGRYKLSAVTGITQIDAGAPDIAPLNDILRWAMLSEEVVDVRQHGAEIDAAREETRAKFKSYFETSGMRAFYAIPLTDDTGRVGVLGLESADPDFLSSAHLEILQVLAAQATVALRNAQMYKEVPFISVLQPMLEKKRKFMAMEKRRRTLMVAAAVAVLIFLAGFPLPMRVDGDAVVAPVHSAQIQPEVEGVVSKVYVREGDHVTRDQVIAELADWEARSALAQAQAKYQTALLQMNRSLAGNDGSEAGVQQVQASFWKSEVARDQELLDKTRLRSPIDGLVATPHLENAVGRHLRNGDSFAEIVDTSRAIVDVAVEDTDSALLRAGAHASVKLNSFPTRIFRGDVIIVSPRGIMQGDSRVFFARVALPNADGAIRAGMEGRGKVRVGWYPAGYVLFRKPLLWIYSRAWSWFGV